MDNQESGTTFTLGSPGYPDSDSVSPIPSIDFYVTIEGLDVIKAKKVTIPESRTRSLKYREGHQKTFYTNIFSEVEYSDLVIEKGARDMEFEDRILKWRRDIERSGTDQITNLKNIVIQVLDAKKNVLRVYNIYKAWPSGVTFSPLDAMSSGLHMQTVSFKFSEMEFISG